LPGAHRPNGDGEAAGRGRVVVPPARLRACRRRWCHEAHVGDRIVPGVVYVARPDLHLLVTPDCRFEYRDGHRIKFVRSSANPLFESAARVFDGRPVAVVLTGGGSDATDGVQSVRAASGTVIVQDQATSEHWSMPESAIRSGAVDLVLPLDAIAPALAALVSGSVQKAPASSLPV
jgi:two-component system, chemotaxis family, protein-glutamate methylesterase/glutaminase